MKNINELCHQTLLDTAEVLDDALGVTEVARGNEDPIGSTSWTLTSEGEVVDLSNPDVDLDELASYIAAQDTRHAEESPPPLQDVVLPDDQLQLWQLTLQHQLEFTAKLLQMNILMHSCSTTMECNEPPPEKATATDGHNKKQKPMRWSFHAYEASSMTI